MTVEQQTFVMLKPDVLERRLAGRIIQQFEDADLSIQEARMTTVSPFLADNHYPWDAAWVQAVGTKAVRTFTQYGFDIAHALNTRNPREVGEAIYRWNKEYIVGQKVLAMVVAGPHAIERVKRITGSTEPIESPLGSIRSRFCTDSIVHANVHKRAIRNLLHRSSSPAEAAREVSLWFD